MTEKLTEVLNTQIANWSLLFTKLHNYHWYVKGVQFFTLHLKFEELYTEAALHVDNLAERLLALGGSPVATLHEIIEKTSLKDAAGNENANEMVRTLVADFGIIVSELKEGMNTADREGDETTGDMLLAIHSSLEKHVWMLKSYLG
ncbi:DNA starvation/stationary phase protection protein [Paenibacillus chondroitinus]|uniref:DNA starvation/stationary phase protection protein n=1 Tax=Paenibacillus chondroitinus TaxID=59842 RepID=A0ABU6DF06_9BACL|nr:MULTISPECIES: Dps family protein [Paenibacillus]MCY9662922.1 DNA starvation/stationary phase protection protein [Paenibacillus anseongense]MEB4795543.1 DNA starvation/stationary phase protection protein [Paenibacillus chondroitinus]